MNKKDFMFFALVIVIMISACAKSQQVVTTKTKQEATPQPEEKKLEEPKQSIQPKQTISPEVKELFDKSKTKVKNIYYKYRGPETGNNFYDFYIKDIKIKYKPYLELKTLDKPDSYDSIFIDKTTKTAASYCEAIYCTHKGKKQDLNYNSAYISTVFDWIDVMQASKVGEEVIESRSTWKIQTEKGIIWVDTFYGVPLKAEVNGKTYRFEQIAVNGVQDSDVVPSS